jgi:hypothetical protein
VVRNAEVGGPKSVAGVIELDDASHQKQARQRRDEFVNKALAAAGVPVVHITAQKAYQPAELRGQVAALVGTEGAAGSSEAGASKTSLRATLRLGEQLRSQTEFGNEGTARA